MALGKTVSAAVFSIAATTFSINQSEAAPNIFGSYTAGVSGVTAGDNPPTIDLRGGLPSPFEVDNLVKGGPEGYANNDPNGLLFTVVPAGCIRGSQWGCQYSTGTENATITVNFTFFDSHKNVIGTASDSALATFNYYSNPSRDTDNLCWLNSAVSGTAVVSSMLVGTCGAPGTGLQTAYEQIRLNLSGELYNLNLYDWNDWNELPKVSFQWVSKPITKAPESSSLALLAGGLAIMGGFLAFRRRRLLSRLA